MALNHKPIIKYSLIACIVLIQSAILLFFYNEYQNGKKLKTIEQQLQKSKVLVDLTKQSRAEVLTAQTALQKFNATQDKRELEPYFLSLQRLTKTLDQINGYENLKEKISELTALKKRDFSNLSDLETMIDSTYQISKTTHLEKPDFSLKKFDVKDGGKTFDIEVEYIADSIAKKGLFGRLKDAVTGDVAVKNNTTIITTKQGQITNAEKMKHDFDSIIAAANHHYENEVSRFRKGIKTTESKQNKIFQVYDKLLLYSNDLMGIYETAVNDFRDRLQKQYNEQNSIAQKTREYALLGLMLLMFLVLIIVLWYTRQAFIYERKLKEANEKITQNLNFKSRILGMLSHEVRAPLKIINLFIDRIGKISKEEKVQGYLKSIKFTNNSLLIQANQILEYTKNQEKKTELRPVPFNLKKETESLLTAFTPYIESRNNRFEITDEIPKDLNVKADNTKIHQVLTNILGNANKFTENGVIKVHLQTGVANAEQVKFCVTVSDTGIGIAPEDVEKIFEPYYQGSATEKIENLGAGLGLNLCKEIIDVFKGEISLKSEHGKGTEISFDINLEKI